MFIKLNYTSNKNIKTVFRAVTDIINTASVTSISALQTRATAASYDSTILSGLDAANSEIVRTVNPTGVKAHYNVEQLPQYNYFQFTLEFGVYDNSATKYYTQIRSTTGTSSTFTIGNSITGGTIESSQFPLSNPDASGSANAGTTLTVGNAFTPAAISGAGGGHSNVRTFWAYITNTSMIWCTTNGTSIASGWPSTYNDVTTFCGLHIVSQYTRYDYFNNDANGIIPVVYGNPRTTYATGAGFGVRDDYTSAWNTEYTSASGAIPFRVLNLVSALPQVGTSWPIVFHPQVAHVVNGRSSTQRGWNVTPTAAAATSGAGLTFGQGITTTANQRYPSSDLTGTAFALLPLQWEYPLKGNYGGNLSDQGGFYIFNGDYAAGDTFTLNSKTWMVWPMYYGSTDRIGLAIPKE